ncbi:hypothetical protein ACLOJK_031532 [Asimina triloba]
MWGPLEVGPSDVARGPSDDVASPVADVAVTVLLTHRKNLHSAPREYRSYGAPSSPANCGGCRLRRAVVWVIQTVQHDGNDVPIKNQYLIRRIYLPGGSKLQPPFRLLFLLRRRYGGGSGCNFGSGFSGSGGGLINGSDTTLMGFKQPKTRI